MPSRNRPAMSGHNNPFERIDHEFQDVHRELGGIRKDVSEIKSMLGKHRKEEKDNGKRIDALTKRFDGFEKTVIAEIRKIGRKS